MEWHLFNCTKEFNNLSNLILLSSHFGQIWGPKLTEFFQNLIQAMVPKQLYSPTRLLFENLSVKSVRHYQKVNTSIAPLFLTWSIGNNELTKLGFTNTTKLVGMDKNIKKVLPDSQILVFNPKNKTHFDFIIKPSLCTTFNNRVEDYAFGYQPVKDLVTTSYTLVS